MKLLIDAQLPRRLARELIAAGHDAIHTLDLKPLGNRTPDEAIAEQADREGRIVVTKDSDFVTSFLLFGKPARLLLVSTGNTTNDELIHLLISNLATLEMAFADHKFMELSRTRVTIHE